MLNLHHMVGLRVAYRIRGLQRGDIEAILPRADFAEEQALQGDPLRRAIPGGLNYTVERATANGGGWRPIACGGFRRQGGGDHMLWAYTGDLRPREWAMVARAGRHGLRVLKEGRARSVVTLVRADNEHARGFARQLGFDHEEAWEPPADWTGASYRLMRCVFEEGER